MTTWIGPANINVYDYINAFNDLGTIDWINSKNFSFAKNDIVYIYISKNPTNTSQVVKFMTRVVLPVVYPSNKIDDSIYWKNSELYENLMSDHNAKFVRLELIETYDNTVSLEQLRDNGLKGNIQSFRKLSPEIISMLNSFDVPNIKNVNEPNTLESELFQEKRYLEGKTTTVPINRYERNLNARKECLDYHGYDCHACGVNFEQTYGDAAKNFIHVHHIKPLSEINDEYIINPIKDLVPLCPNCHAMIHKNISIDELRKIHNYNV